MRPPPVYWSQLKRSFWISDFSSNIIETPKSSRDRAERERERGKEKEKEKEKEKLQKSLQIKGKLTF
jgi:hypothetical protein